MKKKSLCILLAVAMVLSMAACSKKAEPAAQTTAAVETTSPVQTEARELRLTDWSLSASTWSSPNGATIHLTAKPESHADGDTASFVIRLDGEEIASVACQWQNDTYIAEADLNAADGYCYYVQLSDKDGGFAEVPVNTPAQPIDENYINMATALESYGSLTLEDAQLDEGALTISSGMAVVQAPRITNGGEHVACAKAVLVLTLDGQEIASQELTMAPGENDRSYQASLENVRFAISETIGEQQELSLRLDAVLTNGQALSAQGGSWHYQNGEITNMVG